MNSDLVVMDNSIVKASYNLSVSEQRLLLSALAQIPKNQPIDPKGVVSGNGKYSTLRFFNCAQWPKFSTTYLGFASP